ncbi:helix-turn-helix domain-containing protein [Pseudomonas caspiana]
MSTIGIRLRQERVRVGLTQRELGLLGGVAANTQGFYEKDKRSPRADYLSRILSAGVDVVYVLTGTPVPPTGFSSGDGVLDPLDAVFDAYLTQSRTLARQSKQGVSIATKLAVFCRNQLTIIAAMKYLAAIAERQGYTGLSRQVASALTAFDRNVSIIDEVVSEPGLHREHRLNSASH